MVWICHFSAVQGSEHIEDAVATTLSATLFRINQGDFMRRLHLFVCLALMGWALSTPAQTTISGNLPDATTWTRAGNPYHVTTACTLAAGTVLTIEPGIDVLFNADAKLVVHGALHAVGTASDSIRLLPAGEHTWGGVRLYSQNNDSSRLHYVRISGGTAQGTDWRDPDSYGGCLCVGTWRSVEGRDRTYLPPSQNPMTVPPFPESAARAELEHVVITGGTGPQGGGMGIQFATVTMRNCTVRNCTGTDRGGGMYASTSRITMQNCTFTRNAVPDTGDNGGGVRLWDSHVLMEDCRITDNTAPGWGGGLHAKIMPGLTMRRCVVTGNSAGDGGGVSIGKQSIMTLEDCMISGNTARKKAGGFFAENHGPWTYPRRTRITMTGCTIRENRSERYAGGYLINCDVDMNRCTVSENAASQTCGALAGYHGNLNMNRCIIARNTSEGDCGGMYAETASHFRLENCIVAGNRARRYGPYAADYRNSIKLVSCIVRGNTPPAPGGRGTIITRYSDVEGEEPAPGPGNLNADPLFTGDGTYTLRAGSPCIDAGSPYVRDVDGSRCDMGTGGGEGGLIDTPRIEIDHPDVMVPSTACRNAIPGTLVVHNTGSRELVIRQLSFPAASEFSTQGTYPVAIEPGHSRKLPVLYTGEEERTAEGVVHSSDPIMPETTFNLTGITGTFVHDTVSGTWTHQNSPYRIIAPLTVPEGDSLIIERGVDVVFDVDVPLRVMGVLRADGAAGDSVRFMSGHTESWGGISLVGPRAVLRFCRISNAHSTEWGGGLSVIGPNSCAEMSDCLIRDNQSPAYGGGVFAMPVFGDRQNGRDTLVMNRCIVRDNFANSQGGGVCGLSNCHVTMSHCIVEGNSTGQQGGGIVLGYTSTANLEHVLITRNTAGTGAGGMIAGATGSSVTMRHCTISDNRVLSAAPDRNNGDGMRIHASRLHITDSIIWGTPRQDILTWFRTGIDISFSNVQGDTTWTGEGNINLDPHFTEDYRLQDGSPCTGTGRDGGNMGAGE